MTLTEQIKAMGSCCKSRTVNESDMTEFGPMRTKQYNIIETCGSCAKLKQLAIVLSEACESYLEQQRKIKVYGGPIADAIAEAKKILGDG